MSYTYVRRKPPNIQKLTQTGETHMTVEDLEIEIPPQDMKFLQEHGFHLEDGKSNRAEIVSKTVYLEMSDECSESLEFMIVLNSAIGSYCIVKHHIQYPRNKQFISQIREFTKRFDIGHLTETFNNFMENVNERLAFGDDKSSKRILQFCQEALDINDESKMLGLKSCNVYLIQ